MPRPPPADLSSQTTFERQAPVGGSPAPSGENISVPLTGQVHVLLPLPVGDGYDYAVPAGMEVCAGDFVEVPLGRRTLLGVVWGPGTASLAAGKIRPIQARLPAEPMRAPMRRLVDWVARYTLSPPGAVLRMAMSVPDALLPAKPVLLYRLAAAPPPGEMKLTAARQRVLEFMAHAPPLPAADIARAAGVGTSVVKNLQPLGLIEPLWQSGETLPGQPDADHPGAVLSGAQAAAAGALRDAVTARDFAVTLLDGVPGAGKTEVYFEAVAAALQLGRQVLVLLPEIALSAQWLRRFEQRFGALPSEWHSDLTGLERRRTWRAVQAGTARVVVGARSALFLPFRDLGLIVVDEEHEGAFKQEDGVIYNARDMAIVRARVENLPAILVSATPSLETMVNVEAGRYGVQHLPARHGGASMAAIEAIDLRRHPPVRGQFLSPVLLQAAGETLERGKQVLLFLNRRGYAPLTLCRACGHQYQCPECDAWLVEHRFRGVLMCHHCGHEVRRPSACGKCGAEDALVAVGPGIERVAEEAAERFPDARRVVLSSDMGTHAQLRERFAEIAAGDYDLIIGTQLVAKGHHFEKLTLVGVLDADLGLAHGDPRAAEKTFQILTQVTGRAGRAARAGRALLQTYHPGHPVMQAMVRGDREAFYAHELKVRESAGLPPFGRLAALIVSASEHEAAMGHARRLLSAAPMAEGLRLFGPADAPVAMVRGRHRVRLLAQSPKGFDLSGYVRFWLGNAERPRGNVRVQVDIDPMSFY